MVTPKNYSYNFMTINTLFIACHLPSGDGKAPSVKKHHRDCHDGDFYALRAPPSPSGETTERGENGVVYSRKIYDYNSK